MKAFCEDRWMPGSNPGMTTEFASSPRHKTQFRDLAARRARGLPFTSRLLKFRGRRECRAPDAPVAARVVVVSTRVSHHGHTGNTRHSPRNGFNGFLRALPGDRACLPPSSADNSANLSASVGASGPHDFAVRFSAVRQRRIRVHRIPSRVRDDREPPLYRDGTAIDMK